MEPSQLPAGLEGGGRIRATGLPGEPGNQHWLAGLGYAVQNCQAGRFEFGYLDYSRMS